MLSSTLTYQEEGCKHTGTTPVASDASTSWWQSVQRGGVQQAVTPHHPLHCPFSHVKQLLDIILDCSHFLSAVSPTIFQITCYLSLVIGACRGFALVVTNNDFNEINISTIINRKQNFSDYEEFRWFSIIFRLGIISQKISNGQFCYQ